MFVLLLASSLVYTIDGGSGSDYCGRSEIPPYSPPPQSSMVEEGQVHVFFRHGARTDFQRTPSCFKNKAQTRYSCSLFSEFQFGSAKGTLVKRYKSGCQVGQLLDYAETQMNRLAAYIGSAYPRTEWKYLRSTDTVRTLGSLELLLSALFASLESEEKKFFNVHVEDADIDPLLMANNECELANMLEGQFPSSQAFLATTNQSEYFNACANLWKDEIGTDFSIENSPDCLLAPDCAGSDAQYPPNIKPPSKELTACVANVHSTVMATKYGALASPDWQANGIKMCQLRIAPFLIDFFHLVHNRTSSLWSTHDDTIACLLASVGLWDGVWPKYAGFVAFETFSDHTRIRVLRDGSEIGWIQSIDLIVPEWMRDPLSYATACQPQVQDEDSSNARWETLIRTSLKATTLIGIGAFLFNLYPVSSCLYCTHHLVTGDF